MAFDSARGMKKVLRFLWGLLIDVCILFVLVKAFSYSFDFAYQVFGTTRVNIEDTSTVTVQIDTDETLLDVAKSLEKAGVIENKYAFILKIRIEGSAGKIVAGTYQLSPGDTNSEIIDTITGVSASAGDTDSAGSSVTAGSTDVSNTGSEGDADSANEAGTGSGVTGLDEDGSSDAAGEEDTSATDTE